MKNQVIKVLDKEHGKEVIKYWKSQGVNTGVYKGDHIADGTMDCYYYGVIDGEFASYSLDDVEETNTEIIELPNSTYPKVMEVSMSSDFLAPYKRVVFMEKCGKYIAWKNARTLEDAESEMKTTVWNYARDIEEKPTYNFKPFDKVLVRDSKDEEWDIDIYERQNGDRFCCLVRGNYNYCIPFEGNEHLLDTTDDI